jgi:hypothetical protein
MHINRAGVVACPVLSWEWSVLATPRTRVRKEVRIGFDTVADYF